MDAYFPEVQKRISYEGKKSTNPLAFKYYDEERIVAGKTMKDLFRFAVAYWHSIQGSGADIFGAGTLKRAWKSATNPMEQARDSVRAAFEFFTKLGVPFWCFHDRDIAPEGDSFSESCKNLEQIVALASELQKETGIKLLWGTANLFSHPRYAHGAFSNPDVHVGAYAAAQMKNAIDATHELGGENYVFWGGREGYDTILNTNISQEREQLARFFQMAVDYKKKIGFKGTFLIEPKPKEPTKHQYDFDSASVLNFLREYNLLDDFKLNIEANHATLAGHTFEHELTVASVAGKLGSIDANTGDPLLGWDTDQFLMDSKTATLAMLVVLKQGGIGSGGFNFDAKLRRGSTDILDLFYGHIGSMDTFARGLLAADRLIKDGVLDEFIERRYESYNSGLGAEVLKGSSNLEDMEKWILQKGKPQPKSGGQEYLENVLNTYL